MYKAGEFEILYGLVSYSIDDSWNLYIDEMFYN